MGEGVVDRGNHSAFNGSARVVIEEITAAVAAAAKNEASAMLALVGQSESPRRDNHNTFSGSWVLPAFYRAEKSIMKNKRDYLKRAARIDELNGHPPGSDGQMVTALKRYNGGRVLVFVMGAFAGMSEDVSRICDIIAHDLARTHVS